jgi:hypothetical protein
MKLDYQKMLSFVQCMLPQFRLTRQRNLALLALGISKVRDGHLTVSEIGRYIPTSSNHWYKFRRIKRFLANLKWSPARQFLPLTRFCLQRFYPGSDLPVIIDQSTIDGRWEVLWASIPFRGRALPIAFRLFRYQDLAKLRIQSQNHLERDFIRQVLNLLPAEPRVILLFDRGYARVSLLRFLHQLDVCYVIRARNNVWVQCGQAFSGTLGEFPVLPGAQYWRPQVICHLQERCQVNLVITHDARAREPWYLLTNLQRASTTVRCYERRFRCEELFRDLKDQLHLETIRLWHTERVARLLFGIVVLYYALTLIGASAQQRGLRKKVCKDKVSLAWMALRLLNMPNLLKTNLLLHALHHSRWSLSYESG